MANTVAAVLPKANNGQYVELSENILQNLWNNLTPQTVEDVNSQEAIPKLWIRPSPKSRRGGIRKERSTGMEITPTAVK